MKKELMPIICPLCKKKFMPINPWVKYCSDECRKKMKKISDKKAQIKFKKRTAPDKKTICRFCGKTFLKTASNQKYCSQECLEAKQSGKIPEFKSENMREISRIAREVKKEGKTYGTVNMKSVVVVVPPGLKTINERAALK